LRERNKAGRRGKKIQWVAWVRGNETCGRVARETIAHLGENTSIRTATGAREGLREKRRELVGMYLRRFLCVCTEERNKREGPTGKRKGKEKLPSDERSPSFAREEGLLPARRKKISGRRAGGKGKKAFTYLYKTRGLFSAGYKEERKAPHVGRFDEKG